MAAPAASASIFGSRRRGDVFCSGGNHLRMAIRSAPIKRTLDGCGTARFTETRRQYAGRPVWDITRAAARDLDRGAVPGGPSHTHLHTHKRSSRARFMGSLVVTVPRLARRRLTHRPTEFISRPMFIQPPAAAAAHFCHFYLSPTKAQRHTHTKSRISWPAAWERFWFQSCFLVAL
jgi:hypothetical protein